MIKKRHRKAVVVIIAVIVLFAVIMTAGIIYVNDYYRAEEICLETLKSNELVTYEKDGDGTIFFIPKEIKAGLIFYAGGKVEYTAYAPLLKRCAENGILCVLPKMPLNLAVFHVNAADGITDKYPDVESWYIGGHSLGGSMASSYLAKHKDKFKGLILLASYSTEDLSDTNPDVLSVYGSCDGVLNMKKYEKYKKNMPHGFCEEIIEGGCHSGFGYYGEQKNDGIPTVTKEEQISITVDMIISMID